MIHHRRDDEREILMIYLLFASPLYFGCTFLSKLIMRTTAVEAKLVQLNVFIILINLDFLF